MDEIEELRSQVHQFIRLFGILNPTKTPCGYALSLSQVLTIQILEEEMPLTIHKLAEKLYLERSTVSRLVDGLVKAGFVLREVNEQNRREVLLYLTEDGKCSVAEVRLRSIGFFQNVLGVLADEDRREIFNGFQKFTTALYQTRRHSQ